MSTASPSRRTGGWRRRPYDGFVRLYDAQLRRIAEEKAPGGEQPYGVAFSPDGTRLAVGY